MEENEAVSEEQPQPYNPLDQTRLGESIVAALIDQPCVPLPPPKRFRGAGLYALHYQGDFPAYAPISSASCETPIYVGKAEPSGRRIGLRGIGTESRLYSRIRKHADSIDNATNLARNDFRCRYLLVDDIWIPLGETLLIERFRPLWNVAVEGFGLNDPGGRRHGGDRSDWDEIHPGRPWRDKMRRKREPEEILEAIRRHLDERND